MSLIDNTTFPYPTTGGPDWNPPTPFYFYNSPTTTENMNKELYQALLAAEADIKNPTKNAKNPFHKNSYANLEAIIDTVKEKLLEHGILVVQGSKWVVDNYINVYTRLIHAETGQSTEETVTLCAKELTAQGLAGVLTYGRRYGLMAALNLASEDDDGNTASGKTEDFASQLKAKKNAG